MKTHKFSNICWSYLTKVFQCPSTACGRVSYWRFFFDVHLCPRCIPRKKLYAILISFVAPLPAIFDCLMVCNKCFKHAIPSRKCTVTPLWEVSWKVGVTASWNQKYSRQSYCFRMGRARAASSLRKSTSAKHEILWIHNFAFERVLSILARLNIEFVTVWSNSEFNEVHMFTLVWSSTSSKFKQYIMTCAIGVHESTLSKTCSNNFTRCLTVETFLDQHPLDVWQLSTVACALPKPRDFVHDDLQWTDTASMKKDGDGLQLASMHVCNDEWFARQTLFVIFGSRSLWPFTMVSCFFFLAHIS